MTDLLSQNKLALGGSIYYSKTGQSKEEEGKKLQVEEVGVMSLGKPPWWFYLFRSARPLEFGSMPASASGGATTWL